MATQAATVQITMPAMGESVTEGTVLDWLKQVGDRVTADEPLVEVSTDKVDAEVPSPAAGTLARILVEPDETVQVGAPLGEIEVGGAPPRDPRAARAAGNGPAADEPSETVDVAFPEMGDSVAEGTVLEWRKQVGDAVAVDDILVEISTDKVDAELPSPVAGTLRRSWCRPTRRCRWAPSSAASRPAPARPAGPVPPAAEPTGPGGRAPIPPRPRRGLATPVAARVASAHGVDVSSVAGSGPRGRVTKEDVLGRGPGQRRARPTAPAPPEGATGADPRAGGHARPLHGREPLDPDRHELPHAAGGRARRPPQGAEGGRQEALLHAPDRLGDRQAARATGR